MKLNGKRIKRAAVLVLTSAFLLSATACGSEGASSKMNNTNSVENAINQQIESEQSGGTTEATTEVTTEATTSVLLDTTQTTTQAPETVDDSEIFNSKVEGVDVDLTTMDSNMVYSTVYQMMADTPKFEGKVVKMKGSYYASYDEGTKQTYFFVIIKDATACCQQGLEFVWGDGSHVYPDEYPADGTEVIVTGTYESYKDNPDDVYSYVHLNNSELEVIASNQ